MNGATLERRITSGVTNTSPLVFLGRSGYLQLLQEVYVNLLVPFGVCEELYRRQERELVRRIMQFLTTSAEICTLGHSDELEEFRQKHKLGKGECEVYFLYRERDVNEAILANTEAEEILPKMGIRIRNVIDLGSKAENLGLFSAQEVDKFYLSLWNANYQPEKLQQILQAKKLIER